VGDASLDIGPKEWEKFLAHLPTRHGQPSDDDRPFGGFHLHGHMQLSAIVVFTDEASVIGKVGKDLEE
jgi:hypothetical protein